MPDKRSASTSEEHETSKQPKLSVAAWVTSSSESADVSALPQLTTCPEAHITDRGSVFIGFVYPLHTASPTYRSALLENLIHVVHPQIPKDMFTPQFKSIPPAKRKSTHNMFAYRVMQLKRGRSGLGGPNDFGTEEGTEDDGETWGAEKIMRVISAMGASDVLVIVSRWYGGTFLGPVRFEHITNVARAALKKHLELEAVQEYRERLQQLDSKIQALRNVSPRKDAYKDLSIERAKRLLLARQRTVETLQRKSLNTAK